MPVKEKATIIIDGVEQVCGAENVVGKTVYSVDPKLDDVTKRKHNEIMICIVFSDIGEKKNETDGTVKTVSKKVMFKTNMDRFEAFEIKGLFDYFKSRNDLKVWALSNGVRSRETYMKLQGGVAPIINLVLKMNNGVLEQMEWRNDCMLGCSITDCKTYQFAHPDLNDIKSE